MRGRGLLQGKEAEAPLMCVCVCVCVCARLHIHVECMYVHGFCFVKACVHTEVHVQECVHTHMHMHPCASVCMHVCVLDYIPSQMVKFRPCRGLDLATQSW